jgi:hypothetical protein
MPRSKACKLVVHAGRPRPHNGRSPARLMMSSSPPSDPVALPAPGRYRHYKGPHYEVLHVARHSETEELLVVYRALYGERGVWVRPLAMFTGRVEVDGSMVPRFAPVGEGA